MNGHSFLVPSVWFPAYEEDFEEPEGKGVRESLLCTEQFVQSENFVNEVRAQSSVVSMHHTVIIDDESGKILEKEGNSEVSKEEEGDGEYYLDHRPESHLAQPSSLDSHPLSFIFQPSNLPAYFSDMDADPSISETERNQELINHSNSEEKAELCSLNVTEKETAKKKTNRVLAAGSQNASCVVLEDVQNPDVNQNLNLGHPTRRSARCATANSLGQQSFKLSSFLVSKGSLDEIQEKGDSNLPEIPEEPAPPARKKTRTFYSAEQLEELERMFQEDHYPDNEKRREIAASVGVTPQRVMVWFQNRRAKWRKIEKMTVKSNKKYSFPAPALSLDPQQISQGTTLLAVTQLSDPANSQPTTITMGTATVNYSGALSGPSISLASTSVASVTGKTALYDSIQTKATSQGSLGSLREELFPAIPSPPPIRRTSLPLNMVFNPNHHIVPLMLENSLASECSPPSQESSPSEAFSYSIQSQSISSPGHCSYPEQLEPTINLEAPYFHPNSQSGAYQFGQYSQHEVPQVHFPIHLSGSALPSVRLTTATPSKSTTTFFSLPGSGGLVTYGATECPQGFLQNHVGGHLLVQPSAGSSGYIPAFQALPWNEFSVQGAPFAHPFSSPIPFSSLAAAGGSSAEQAPFAPSQTLPASSCLLQLPKPARPGTTLLFSTKPAVPANLEPPSQAQTRMPAGGDSDPDDAPREEESTAGDPLPGLSKERVDFSDSIPERGIIPKRVFSEALMRILPK
ncbi:homeobox protein NOBOX [Python bivittatus]|uniref:Homeobox protein NOBOX n=1 Tax=Python bivittatus TaxID=176946 RepID=A0A9F5IRY3_PYTBI|nr:homeobox protein NOBOX [Python bivittatus]